MTQRVMSLAALTVLELSPVQMVEVAARAGYSHVGLRLEPATPEEHHFALVADAELRRQTAVRLRDTGIKVLDVEILRLKPETRVADFEALLAVGAEFGASELLVAGNERRFPGDGDCDLTGLLGSLPASIPLSLEIPTRQLYEQGVSALQRAQMALDTTRQLLLQR